MPFVPVTSKDSSPPVQPVPKRKPSLLIGDRNSPSLAFLHKPARSNSGNESKEYRKLMEENTRKNGMQHIDRKEIVSPAISSTTTASDVSITASPSSASIPLIRKKSGEFVRSSLKSHSRSASLPSTPTYKQVHFGGDEEAAQIKYFDEKDTPQTISGNNSPSDWSSTKPRDYFNMGGGVMDDLYSDYDESAIEDDMLDSKSDDDSYTTRLLLRGEWKLTLSNFPDLSYPSKFKQDSKVFLERIFISDDKENLCGQIAVKNLSFAKQVVVRYSLDSWRSVTEIDCHYVTNATAKLRRNKYDRFEFEIPLVTLFHNTEETVHPAFTDVSSSFALCIRYQVAGEDFWDNNGFDNFNVILHKITPKKSDTHRVDTHYPKHVKHSSKFLAKKKEEEESRALSPALQKEFTSSNPSHSPVNPSQALTNFLYLANKDEPYGGNSPDTPRVVNTPYSPVELNPRNRDDFRLEPFDGLNINFAPPKSPMSLASSPMYQELSPLEQPSKVMKDPVPVIPGTERAPASAHPHTSSSDRPPISSAKYQELLDKYCFFGGDSAASSSQTATVGSVLGNGNGHKNKDFTMKQRPSYSLGNVAGYFNNNDSASGYMSSFDGYDSQLSSSSLWQQQQQQQGRRGDSPPDGVVSYTTQDSADKS